MTDSMFGARDVQGEHGTSCHFRRKLSQTDIYDRTIWTSIRIIAEINLNQYEPWVHIKVKMKTTIPNWSWLEDANEPTHYSELGKGKNQAFILPFFYEMHDWLTK